MHSLEILLGLLLAALGMAILAKRLDQPYPIALVVGGMIVAFVPGFDGIHLNPELVFYVLLPPILFEAAYFTSWRDFWRWRRAILLLAFGLVAATSVAVASLCVLLIPGMTWATGLVLGSIVSPPDAAAATSILRGIRLPRRIVQILEGESLVNDASALTLYRFAVATVVTGSFSLTKALTAFVWISLGGVAIGLVLGYAFVKLFPRLRDPEVEILAPFLLSYAAYYVAESVHASGVLATVAAGLVVGWFSPQIYSAITRIRATAVWQSVIFLINVTIFILIGLQIPFVLRELRDYPIGFLILWSVAISLCVIVIRFLWIFPAAYLPRHFFPSIRAREAYPEWQGVVVVGWTGLRGVVSLAAVLALPMETASGLPFPYRNLLLLLTFAVILSTLLLQGLTLRPLVRLLRIPEDRSSEEEELHARIQTTETVLTRLGEMQAAQNAPIPVLERIRGFYEDRLADLRSQLAECSGTEDVRKPEEFKSIAEQRIWWEAVNAERRTLVTLRRTGRIGDEAMHQIERDIDLLEARIIPRS